MKETMTIHKALSELKTINDRIEKNINNAEFVTVNKHGNQKINGRPIADFIEEAKNSYKSIATLINRRNAIKCGVTKSNAITYVEVAGKKYTVAEAIDMKNIGMQAIHSLVGRLTSQFVSACRNAERKNGEELDRRADDYVKTIYENADMKNLSDELKKVREAFVESQTFDVVDPVNAKKLIDELTENMENFLSEVDAALSVSNALTTIGVEYDVL